MWPNLEFPAYLVAFTEEILHGKFHFLCGVSLKISWTKSSSRRDGFDYFRNLFGSNMTLLPCIITIEISFFKRFCLFCLYLAPEIINKVTTLLLNDINNSSLFHTMPLWQSTYYLCSNYGTSPTGGRLEKDKNSHINYEKVKPLLFCLKKIL